MRKQLLLTTLLTFTGLTAGSLAQAAELTADQACQSLTSLNDNSVTVTSVTRIAGHNPEYGNDLSAFCRMTATLRPSADSDIRVEVWLPEHWNGSYLGTGNGGLGGKLDKTALEDGVRRGFAVANTDLGTSAGAAAMTGKMDMVADFGYRATHLMTLLAKAAIVQYYHRPPSWSFFRGCSTGGGQGMHEAQQFPADYNGILAGAPGASRVPAHLAFFWAYRATHLTPDSALTPAALTFWSAKVMQACDKLDGLQDGIISDPQRCTLNPQTVQCKPGQSSECLTPGQVVALNKIYAGPRHSVTGEQIFPGYLHGTEAVFNLFEMDENGGPPAAFPFIWLWGQHWDWKRFNFGSDVDVMRNALDQSVAATNPDLSAFHRLGGKLIMYQGLADPIQVPGAAIDYVKAVHHTLGSQASDTVQLFLAPGMNHCDGGNAPNDFGNFNDDNATYAANRQDAQHDLLNALQNWVEKGVKPTQVIATQFTSDKPAQVIRTRPLCAWPETAHYRGGNVNQAQSFYCAK